VEKTQCVHRVSDPDRNYGNLAVKTLMDHTVLQKLRFLIFCFKITCIAINSKGFFQNLTVRLEEVGMRHK